MAPLPDPLAEFKALPEEVRQHILDTNADDYTIGYNWWEDLYENFTSDMHDIGIKVDKIEFSGFCSQGDGASFTGRVDGWIHFLNNHMPDLKREHREFLMRKASFTMDRRSIRYCHSMTVSGDLQLGGEFDLIDPDWLALSPYQDQLRSAVWAVQMKDFDYIDIERQIESSFRAHMDDLYSQLEAQHDYLRSDERVLGWLIDIDRLDEEVAAAVSLFSEEAHSDT